LKKLTAILLIALFAFNLFGYRIFFYSIQQQSDKILETAIDNNQYDDRDLITVKIPLSMPYQVGIPEFERYNGEVNFDGITYKYVKRKVVNGELVLMCLPDKARMSLETAKNNIFKSVNDLQGSSTGKSNTKGSSVKNIAVDYNQSLITFSLSPYNCISKVNRVSVTFSLASPYYRSADQPPEFA
jgi:hypothetical protein